jgi:GxxExxY protein
MELPIYYDEIVVGKRRVDFLVEEKIVVELKAISDLTDKELNQSLNYLENHRKEIGLLINFGAKSLQFKRLINQKRLAAQNNPSNP